MKRLLAWLRWLLGYEGIALMARPTLRYEILSSLFAAGGLAMLVRQFTQLFARMSLQASELILAVLLAERAIGNLSGVFLARFLQRRRRVPYVVAGRVLIAVMMLAISLLPARRGSAWPYAILLLGPAILSAVVLNMQAAIWQSNFPADTRGRLYARLFLAKLVVVGVTIKLAGYALHVWPGAHHLLYPLGAACMLASAAVYRRIRVRGERRTLRAPAAHAMAPLSALRVLREDPAYAKFMFWQMISGGTVLMCLPVVTVTLTDHLGVDWQRGTTALALVPFLVSPIGALLAGRLFDAIGITRYRAVGAVLWALGRGMIFAAAACHSWTLALAAFAVRGLAQSTGGVAFNIGHTRFAPLDRGQLYMGIHMTLQGVRGLTMPFLGIWLYQLPGVGIRLLPIAMGIQLVAAVGFWLTRPPAPDRALAAD